jgi:hypothetical protein
MNSEKQGSGCLKIFLWGVGICFLVIAGVSFYIATHIGEWTRAGSAKIIETLADETLRSSHLPEEDKKEIKIVINQFVQDIKDERVGLTQGMAIMTEIATGPLMVQGLAHSVKEKYVQSSSLTPDEKDQADLEFSRLIQGVFEQKISPESLQRVMEMTTTEGVDSEGKPTRVPKPALSEEELRELISEAKSLADSADVPNERFEPNLPQALRDAIKRGMEVKSMEELGDRYGKKTPGDR